MESSPPSSKKAKALGNIAQVAHCLVDGCSADLSLCRDYHRRHKVCEAHSKTPKVTIGGREQRFCQQCSRFHSLVEFDEGKRSCRKRLDGHNRRRRKPQPECHPRGSGQGTTRLVSFSSSPQILGSSVVGYSWSGVVKPEHEMGVVCNNQQVQLSYMETGSRYKGVSEVGIQEGSMFVDPSQRMFDSDGALSLLSSGTLAPREFGSRHDHYHHDHDHVPQTKQVIDYNGVGAGAGAGQYEESKGEEASPASSVSTFHFPEMFQQGMGSSTHQTLSFMWE